MKSLSIIVWRNKDVGGPARINFRRQGPLFSRSHLPLQQKIVGGSHNKLDDVPDPDRWTKCLVGLCPRIGQAMGGIPPCPNQAID